MVFTAIGLVVGVDALGIVDPTVSSEPEALRDATLAVAVYAVLSLTVVRILPVGAAMLGTDARRPTVGFLG
jgi:hypothetical protein